ncbi:MAG: branched-chain amino acid ABC transporter ATP-binding protein/permease [Actinobacteria bacterium]|nr:branched-chain amino acid ABC transporter ATP-binding protein/permease [Actinomycetota bacterium]
MSGRLRVALVGALITGLLLAIAVALMASTGNKALAATAVVLAINVALVVSLQTFIGNTGILSFGHVAFMGIGAFTAALLTIPPAAKKTQLPNLPSFIRDVQVPPLPAVLIASLVCLFVAALFGLVLVRMTTSAMVMATFALLITTYTVLLNWADWTRGSEGVYAVPRVMTPWLALAVAVVFIVIARLLAATWMGLQARAIREDELAAGATGIRVRASRYAFWIISASLMGAAGAIYAENVLAFDAGQFSFATTFALLAMLIIGGRESVLGSVVGAALIVLVTEMFSRVEQGFSIGGFELPRISGTVQFVLALLIILALIWKPDGIVGRREVEDLIPGLRGWAERSTTPTPGGVPDRSGFGLDEVVLSGKNLSKSFSGVKAVQEIDIHVARGEILGLIGPNGSGKSTLLNLLSGLTAADSGTVELCGVDVTDQSVHSRALGGLGRTFQNIRLFNHLTVLDNVLAPPRSEPHEAAGLLDQLGLLDVASAEADTLAYGQQRRLEIARALSTQVSVILMDEPAAGMNEEESDVLLDDIRALAAEHRCGVIIIDHDLRLITRLCDRIQVLETGRTIAIGTPDEIVQNRAVREAYLGDAVGAEDHEGGM